MCFYFALVAANASVTGNQLALLDIKLLCRIHHPFMVTVLAQDFAFMPLFKRRLTKGNNISHGLQQCALHSTVPGIHSFAAS
jgi:hypothetical protein